MTASCGVFRGPRSHAVARPDRLFVGRLREHLRREAHADRVDHAPRVPVRAAVLARDTRERAGGAPEARDAVEVVEGMLVAGFQRLRQAVIREDDVPFGIGQVGVGFAALKGGVGDERLVGLRRGRPRHPSSTYATGDSSSSVATRRLTSDHLRTLRSLSTLRRRSQSRRIIATSVPKRTLEKTAKRSSRDVRQVAPGS